MGKVERNQLMEDVCCKELAIASKKGMEFKTPLEEMLADQFIACHKLSLNIIGRLYSRDERYGIGDDEQAKLVNSSVKLMKMCQESALVINKLQTGGQQTVVVKHQNVQVNDGGQAIVANDLAVGGGDGSQK
jgi:hypothetical protein